MRRMLFVLMLLCASAVPALAQFEPQPVIVVDPANPLTGIYPFGAIVVGTSSTGVRVGPFGCYVNTTDPTYTTAQIHPCSLTTAGRIRVDTRATFLEEVVHVSGDPGFTVLGVRGASCGSALSGGNGRYQPFQFDSLGNLCMNIATNSAGSATDIDDGTVDDAQANVALVLGLPMVFDGSVHVRRQGFHLLDDAVFTPTADGVAVAGFFADETSTDSVDEGDTGAGRMTLDRKQIVTSQPHTAGGLTPYIEDDLDESETEFVTGVHQLYAMHVTNTHTATLWVRCYDATAANVTVGTTTRKFEIGVPGNASDDILANLTFGGHGVPFVNAITCAATTGKGPTDTGAPSAAALMVTIYVK